MPVVAGLGYKKKELKKKTKPRTLLEKREEVRPPSVRKLQLEELIARFALQMEADIKKYGYEAVSKMYAMQDEATAAKRRAHRYRS